MRLPPGKIPTDILTSIVFQNLGVKRKEVAVGPSVGIDGAVIDIADKSLIVSTDPITGAVERLGWLAANINANDVATFGVEPAFLLPCILLPEGYDTKSVEIISQQMDKAAKNLGMGIVGGHSEITPRLSHPIVVGCAMGITNKGEYVTAGGAKPGDILILTKSVAIEGTAILAADKENQLRKAIDRETLEAARKFYDQISVVQEAIMAFKTGGVDAMHDPTEGGVAGGIHEMADASRLGVQIQEDSIPIRRETSEICRVFEIDPLQLTSSGTLLISAKPMFAERIIRILKKRGIPATVIGEFLEAPETREIVGKNGKKRTLPRPLSDHLWLALEK